MTYYLLTQDSLVEMKMETEGGCVASKEHSLVSTFLDKKINTSVGKYSFIFLLAIYGCSLLAMCDHIIKQNKQWKRDTQCLRTVEGVMRRISP